MKLPQLAATLQADRQPRAAMRSTRARSRKRSSPTARRTAAISRSPISPTTPTNGSSPSRRTIAATTSGSCRPTARASPRCKCSTCWSSTICKSLGHNSAEHLHLFIEAKKLAFADRAKFYADPAFGELPVKELISKEYGQAAGGADRPEQGGRRCAAGRSEAGPRATRSTCASSIRTATAAR